MKSLTTVSSAIDATLLQHKLSQEGIKSFLVNENMSTMFPHLNGMLGWGVHVMVREEDYEKAEQILKGRQDQERFSKCPHCGSSNIGFGMRGKNRVGEKFLIILSMIFGMPVGNIKNKYHCKDCKEVFV
jgi:hypothetical protein